MRKSLGIVAIVAGFLGLLGAGTELLSSDPNIMVSAFLVLCALLSIALGVAEWRNRHKPPFNYTPLLLTAGVAGAVIGMAPMVLALN